MYKLQDKFTQFFSNIDKEKIMDYGKEFANGLFMMFVTLLICGIVSLLGKSGLFVFSSVIILLVGITVSVIIFINIQKKYNGGIF